MEMDAAKGAGAAGTGAGTMDLKEAEVQGLAHHLIIEGIIRSGHAPRRQVIAKELGMVRKDGEGDADLEQIEALYKRMADNHALVLHPHEPEPWIIHPFSLSPTATWVESVASADNSDDGAIGWWAPCMWCAFGIVKLIGGRGVIHSRLAGEKQPIALHVDEHTATIEPRDDLLVHFSVPPRRAWDNVHHTCGCCLPFASEHDIDVWAKRHGLERGVGVPIKTLAALARVWYGRHRDRDWRKWSVNDAQRIFNEVGLTDSFWTLQTSTGRF
jgi:hypothetical protein